MYISTPPSSGVENFQMKIYYPAGDRTPDPLNQMQTCYHLSQHGEHIQESHERVSIPGKVDGIATVELFKKNSEGVSLMGPE